MSPKKVGLKRKREVDQKCTDETARADERPLCKYGELCYQKNAFHLKKFRHPHKEGAPKNLENTSSQAEEAVDQEKEGVKEKSVEATPPTLPSPNKVEEPNPKNSPSVVAEDVEEPDMPSSPADIKEHIKQKFLFEMPPDFYAFWEFCCHLNEVNPTEALSDSLGLRLVGPFELFNASHDEAKSRKLSFFLTQWRFYFDPPEFQCVLVGDMTKGYHIGYFRDNPCEMPVFVGSNTESEDCVILPMAENLFGSISVLLTEKLKKCDPFHKTRLTSLRKQLDEWTSKNNIAIKLLGDGMKARKKKVVAKTFYLCGIVVPVNPKTQVGYRKIPESDSNIKKICKRIAESKTPSEEERNSDALQELVTYVQYANDEMDYGMGLELGLDLLAYGGEVFHSTIRHLLTVAFELLEQPEFAVILKAHLSHRRRISLESSGEVNDKKNSRTE